MIESTNNLFGIMYFSSTTFFTSSYGDVCPGGWSKLVAVLNAWAGQVFTVIILALALQEYFRSRDYRRPALNTKVYKKRNRKQTINKASANPSRNKGEDS